MAWGSSSCRPTAEETERRCSSMLLLSQHKVQREATPNVKRPKLPLPPHGFHTYEAEYERKTTVTSCIIYLVADIWFQSSCSSIRANKPNTVLHKFLPAQRVISSHVCRLYQCKRGRTSHFIQVEYTGCGKKTPKPWAEPQMKETWHVAVLWYWLALIWLDEVQVFLWYQLNGNMWDPECMCAYGPEDVHHNGGVEWEGLGWGQNDQYTIPHWGHLLICACQLYSTKVNTAQIVTGWSTALVFSGISFVSEGSRYRRILCACVVCGPEEKSAKTKTDFTQVSIF